MGGKVWIVLSGVLALLIVGRVALHFVRTPDDKTLIHEALMRSVDASRQGEPDGVLELFSRNLEVNDIRVGNRKEMIDFIKKQKPNIEVQKVEPLVNGDEASLVSPVRILGTVPIINREIDVTVPEVTFVFQKESGTRWGIVPTKVWKLTKVYLPQEALEQAFDLSF